MWKKYTTIIIFHASFVYAVFLFAGNEKIDILNKKPVEEADISLSKSSSKLAGVF